MNFKKMMMALVALVGCSLLATAANAQTVVVATGSSGIFPTVGIAAFTPDPINGTSPVCGGHLWTGKNGSGGETINGIDPRGGAAEPGNLFVVWDNNAAPTTICAYLVVDSVVGLRLFFAQGSSGNGTLQVTNGTNQNVIVGLADTDTTLPTPVLNAINGAHFNMAFSDIRPEDGQFAYARAAAAQGSGGFGYNTTGVLQGTAIYSSFSNTNAQVDNFRVSGTDPISGQPIPASTTVNVGAYPIVIIAGTQGAMGTNSCGTGTFPTNILSKTAEKFFSGQIGSSQSVFGPSVCNAVMSEIQREPMSGTYNTFEFQLVHARDGSAGTSTQELNTQAASGLVNPTPTLCFTGGAAFSACSNPMYINSGANSIRYRAIGGGEMVKAVNLGTTVHTTNPDTLGYSFYSLGSFFQNNNSGTAHALNMHYLTLQGVDPLYSNYDTGGAFGLCTGAITSSTSSTFQCTTKLPNLASVANGSYRVWNTGIAAINSSSPALASTLVEGLQDQAAYALLNPGNSGENCANCTIFAIADLVPSFYYPSGIKTPFLKVFRSHYGISGVDANNGTNGTSAFCAADQTAPNCGEEGGSMAGVGFFNITDVNYYNATGDELITQIE